MRAARLMEFGETPTFAVVDVPAPVPGPLEVVVDIRAAALNRRDWWIWRDPGYCPLPVTLGSDGAGVVSGVGSDVSGVAVGDEVVINPTLGWRPGEHVPGPEFDILGAPLDGTWAEQVVVPAANVAPRPERLSWEEAAALNLGGLTAWRATVTCAGAAPGRRILVTGAGSGVATFAVQIAASLGAEVFATTSAGTKTGRLDELGVSQTFLYTDSDWHEQVRAASGGGVDAVIDSYGGTGWPLGLKALRDGGVFVTFGDTGSAEATVEIMDVYWHWRSIVGTSMGSHEEYRALLEHVATSTWVPVVDSVFPLDKIDDACARFEHAPDRFGKVVVVP